MGWLVLRVVRRAVRRLVLAGIGVAFPVGMLAATLLLIDDAVHEMTPVALAPVQVEMRALATSLDVDMTAITRDLAAVRGVHRAERFASADVTLRVPGRPERIPARLFAIDPGYVDNHPWVRVEAGRLGDGVLLNPALYTLPAVAGATSVEVLPAGVTPADQPAEPAEPGEPAPPGPARPPRAGSPSTAPRTSATPGSGSRSRTARCRATSPRCPAPW
jgi:putative ABC transport system permease protein